MQGLYLALLLVLLLPFVRSDAVPLREEARSAPQTSTRADKPLSVLLISSFWVGHLVSLVAVGEELVARGHNVSLFATVMAGSHVVPNLPERLGINFISAGPDPWSREDFEQKLLGTINEGFLKQANTMLEIFEAQSRPLHAAADTLIAKDWDVILSDYGASTTAYFLTVKWNHSVPIIMHMPYTPVLPDPGWLISQYTDFPEDMTFLQRLQVAAMRPLFYVLFMKLGRQALQDPRIAEVGKTLGNPFITYGYYHPVVMTTAFGFEQPRSYYPTMHLVGPTIMKSSPPMAPQLQEWLEGKRERKVVYISMGSTGYLTPDNGQAIVEGILRTDYDVVWSLRENNRDILEGLDINEKRFYISKWVSQQAVLQHRAVGVALLHGGLNGVQEALYYKVPVIAIPFMMEHAFIATKLETYGVGVRINSWNLTADNLVDGIHAIEDGDFWKNVARMSEIFHFAGGVEKEADLVEFYAEVGYDHLILGFVRYQWSWVQYYNIDVYAVLLCVLAILTLAVWGTCKCMYRRYYLE